MTTTAGAAYTSEFRTYDTFGNFLHSTWSFCAANPDGTRGPCGTTSVLPLELTGTTNRYADLTYDSAGNVTRDDARIYNYDAAGMMTSYKHDTVDFRYLYSPSDERIAAVQRITGSDGVIRNRTTYTLRNFNNQLLSVWTTDPNSGALQWKEDEIWRGSALLARRAASGGVTHYALDHLGSPRAITNSTGILLGTQDFTPFGYGGTSNSGALQFTGHERDAANLLNGTGSMPDYMHARYYDVGGGRFLSVDPVLGQPRVPQSWNRYAYALNNPLRFIDPTGEYSCQGTSEECKQIEARIETIRQAVGELHPEHEGRAVLQAVADFYGAQDEENNVIVNVSTENRLGSALTVSGVTTIRVNLAQAAAIFSESWMNGDIEMSGVLAHEGQHGINQRAKGHSRSFAEAAENEVSAYTAQAYVNLAKGVNSAYDLWNRWQGLNRQRIESSAMRSVFIWCAQPGALCQ